MTEQSGAGKEAVPSHLDRSVGQHQGELVWAQPQRSPAAAVAVAVDAELGQNQRRRRKAVLMQPRIDEAVAQPPVARLAAVAQGGAVVAVVAVEVRVGVLVQAQVVEILQIGRDDLPVGVQVGRIAHPVIQADDFHPGHPVAQIAGAVAQDRHQLGVVAVDLVEGRFDRGDQLVADRIAPNRDYVVAARAPGGQIVLALKVLASDHDATRAVDGVGCKRRHVRRQALQNIAAVDLLHVADGGVNPVVYVRANQCALHLASYDPLHSRDNARRRIRVRLVDLIGRHQVGKLVRPRHSNHRLDKADKPLRRRGRVCRSLYQAVDAALQIGNAILELPDFVFAHRIILRK